jgi:hypothetical protein
MRINKLHVLSSLLVCSFLYATNSYANDSAADITPSGIIFKTMDMISIEREDLFISEKKIEVTYEFKNHSRKEITTEIVFPVPEYEYFFDDGRIPSFDDFTVEVNNKRIDYKKEIKAILNGKDYADVLNRMRVTITNFGNFDPVEKDNYFLKLSNKDQKELVTLGLCDEGGWPHWKVVIKYYWSQIFPADSKINIKHKYTPYPGFRGFYYTSYYHTNWRDDPDVVKSRDYLQNDACISENNQKLLESISNIDPMDRYVYPHWVSYILVTANNWRQPIGKFHLIIEKEKEDIMSVCFDHALLNTAPDRFEVTVPDFVPKNDLKVYFFKNDANERTKRIKKNQEES